MIQGSCVDCASPLLPVDGGCGDCPSSTFHDPFLFTCVQCVDHCIDCKNLDECNECENDYFVFENRCIKEPNCLAGYYFEKESNPSCLICSDNCLSCTSSSDCVNCHPGFYLNESNLCTLCSENCLKCVNKDHCLICSRGYILSDDQCKIQKFSKTSEQSKSVLLEIDTSSELNKLESTPPTLKTLSLENCLFSETESDCQICRPKYFLKNSQCLECPEGCLFCRTDLICLQCSQDYLLETTNGASVCVKNVIPFYRINLLRLYKRHPPSVIKKTHPNATTSPV